MSLRKVIVIYMLGSTAFITLDIVSVLALQKWSNSVQRIKTLPAIDEVGSKFKSEPYLVEAIELQELGRDAAIARLTEAGGNLILCRMLFKAKAGGEFRPPELGVPGFVARSSDWPLEPIEIVDGVPFRITHGYDFNGKQETPLAYLNYCINDCDWNDFTFRRRSRDEMATALAKLINSAKWLDPLRDWEKKYLEDQI